MKTPKDISQLDLTFIKDEAIKRALEDLFLLFEENHEYYYSDLSLSVSVLSVNDTTPSVKNGKAFITANTQATAITDFDDAQNGQTITIICNDANTSIADSGNFKLSVAWAPNADDTITLVHYNGIWFEMSRSAN